MAVKESPWRRNVPRRVAVFYNGVVLVVVGLTVGLVTGDFHRAALSFLLILIGGLQVILAGLYLVFHHRDYGHW